jgi:hypothetical protein
MPEGGTSIQASVRLAAGLLLYRLLCARGCRETLSEQKTCAQHVPQDVERALVKIARMASNWALSAMGKGCIKKGKDWGNRRRNGNLPRRSPGRLGTHLKVVGNRASYRNASGEARNGRT